MKMAMAMAEAIQSRRHVTSVTPEQLAHSQDSPEAKKIVDDDSMSEVVKTIQDPTGGARDRPDLIPPPHPGPERERERHFEVESGGRIPERGPRVYSWPI